MAKKKKEVKKPLPPLDKDTPVKVNTSFENLLKMAVNTPPKKKNK